MTCSVSKFVEGPLPLEYVLNFFCEDLNMKFNRKQGIKSVPCTIWLFFIYETFSFSSIWKAMVSNPRNNFLNTYNIWYKYTSGTFTGTHCIWNRKYVWPKFSKSPRCLTLTVHKMKGTWGALSCVRGGHPCHMIHPYPLCFLCSQRVL